MLHYNRRWGPLEEAARPHWEDGVWKAGAPLGRQEPMATVQSQIE